MYLILTRQHQRDSLPIANGVRQTTTCAKCERHSPRSRIVWSDDNLPMPSCTNVRDSPSRLRPGRVRASGVPVCIRAPLFPWLQGPAVEPAAHTCCDAAWRHAACPPGRVPTAAKALLVLVWTPSWWFFSSSSRGVAPRTTRQARRNPFANELLANLDNPGEWIRSTTSEVIGPEFEIGQ